MLYEFLSFEAYEAACKRDTGLLGFFPREAASELEITSRTLSKAIRRGSVDVVRVYMGDGFNLYVTLASMHRYWADRSNHLYPCPFGNCCCFVRIKRVGLGLGWGLSNPT